MIHNWILSFELQIAVWCSDLSQYRHRWLIMQCWCFSRISESRFFMLMIDKFMRSLKLEIVTFKSVENVAYLTKYARTVEITETEWITAFNLKRFCTVTRYWLFNCWHSSELIELWARWIVHSSDWIFKLWCHIQLHQCAAENRTDI